MSNLDVTENTLQFVIKVFAILLAVIVLVVLATYAEIVIRDGDNPLVQAAFSDLVSLGQWAIGVMGAIILGKPVASGVANFFNQKNSDINSVANTVQAAQSITASLPQTPIDTGQTAS
jgi:hypothetical protein